MLSFFLENAHETRPVQSQLWNYSNLRAFFSHDPVYGYDLCCPVSFTRSFEALLNQSRNVFLNISSG